MNSGVYSMPKRDARLRIVEAMVELHEEIGPAATTVTAIAERAGVQRLTVYRHFPDDRAMLGACSAHWLEAHPLPNSADWTGIADPGTRLETALRGIYDYFQTGAPMLVSVLRDEERMEAVAEVMVPLWDYFREVAGGLSAGWDVNSRDQRRVRAAVGHALGFYTWRSLANQGLSNPEAVELMTGLVAEVAARTRARTS
jgi:AcrR family transcriptional regulator